jgi:hypothetical protein
VLRPLANSVLRWSLVGVLGITSLLGGGLHDILGIHHAGYMGGAGSIGPASAASTSFSASGLTGPSVAAGQSQSCQDEANCPICNYLAQGRLVGERFEGVSVTVNLPHPSPEIPLFVSSPHLQPFQARAPPAV